VEARDTLVVDEGAWQTVEELGCRLMVELDELQEKLQEERVRSPQAADLLVRLGYCI
jgi:hypothetical protein